MANGTFTYPDRDGNRQKLVNPSDYDDYNIVIGIGDVDNATDATATLYTEPGSSGRSESIYPGGSLYSDDVFLCCRFTT